MPNDADADRISSSLKNGTVIDLGAYRAASIQRKMAEPYFNPMALSLWGIVFFAIVLAVAFRR